MSAGGRSPVTSSKDQSLDEQMRGVRIVWFALLGGLLFYCLVIFIVGPLNKGAASAPQSDLMLSAILAVTAVGAAVGQPLAKRQLRTALLPRLAALRGHSDPLLPAIGEYRVWVIRSASFVEGAGLVGCVAYLVRGVPAAAVVIGLAIVWFLVNVPTADRARRVIRDVLDGG